MGERATLDMKAAAEYCGVDYDTFRAYVKKGFVVAVQYPSLNRRGPRRKKLFRKSRLDEFIAQSEQEAGTAVGTNRVVPATVPYPKRWHEKFILGGVKS